MTSTTRRTLNCGFAPHRIGMHEIESGGMPLDVLPDPHVVLDSSGVLLGANQHFDRRLLAEPRALQHIATATDSPFDLAVDFDGARHVYSVSWTPCRWHGVAARLVRLADVREERLHVEALERGLHAVEDALDALPASLVMVDRAGDILSANARWHVQALSNGLPLPNAGVGTNYLAVCDRAAAQGDEQAAQAAAGLRTVLERRALAFEMDYHMAQPGGEEPRWYRLSIHALGTHQGAVVLHEDTTDARRQQSERLDALAHFKAVFDGALDGIVIFDDDLRIVSSNTAAAALMGLTVDEALRLPVLDVVNPPEHEYLLAQFETLRERGDVRGEVRLRHAAGETVQVEYAARANVVPGRHVAVVRDITMAREMEAQLRQAQKMEALGQLTGGIAHDFNNILTIIQAQADLILADVMLPGEVQEGLTQMLRAAQRGADMVRKLMAFGRREQLRVEPVLLEPMLAEVSGILRRLLPETIGVSYYSTGDIPPVLADLTAVQQILLNLATNARDAMRDHGGQLRLSVQLQQGSPKRRAAADARPAPGHERHARVSVRDTGSGMTDDVLSHIFEPFFTTKRAGEGTGLGMSMVYGLMEQMGGQVTIDTRVGHGTTIHLHFPLAPTSRNPSSPEAGPGPATGGKAGGGSERILLVEDDDAIRALTARVLRRAGYEVTEAISGDDAAERLRALAGREDGRFSLIVSDVVMPNGDGARVLEAARRHAAPTRIVWVSGYAGDGFPTGPVGTAVDAPIIHKPWTTSELLAQVRGLLDGPPNVPLDDAVTHVPSRPG